VGELARRAQLWERKWRWYERNTLPWNRGRIHWELMRREAFARWPVHGNVLEALQDGRLEIGAGVLLEPGVWITAPGSARVRIGAGTFLNMGVMVASQELVEIGENCMLANGCFVSDSSERCVIGAGSVVTRDIESHSIAAGAPARVLRRIEYV
jgi:acetyltransferase-like isoleucine patch superfamily enzyme